LVTERHELRRVLDGDEARAAAAAALAALRQHDVRRGHLRTHFHDARTAAATDRLGEDRVRSEALRLHAPRGADGDVAGRAAGAAFEAECHREAHRILLLRVLAVAAERDGRAAALAAAVADALREDAGRAIAQRRDEAVGEDRDVPAGAAGAADAAERHADRAAGRRAAHQVGRDVATAAADRLRENAGRVVTRSRDVAFVADRDRIARAAVARGAADREVHADAAARIGHADVDARIAATAADRLRDDALRAVARGRDVAAMLDARRGRVTGLAAATADRHLHRDRRLAAFRCL